MNVKRQIRYSFICLAAATIIIGLLVSCADVPVVQPEQQNVFPVDTSEDRDDAFTREFHQQIGDNMPEYIFELSAFKDETYQEYHTTAITIKDSGSEKIIQEILLSEHSFNGEYVTYHSDDLGFIIEDMNFDGYADIRIVEFLPAGPNIPYICWLWDKEGEQYVYDSALSNVASLEVDNENKLIYASGRSTASEHYSVYYQYIDGSLTLIKEVRSGFLDENDPNQGYSITHELIDGQWIMTGKEKINIGG